MTIHSSHKTVSVDELTIDPRVQRVEGVDMSRVNKMVDRFDPLALGTITVSQRTNGTLVVIDGAHRTAAARQAEYKGFLNAEVITGLSLQQEARLFELLNTSRKPSAISLFLARVVMQDPATVDMNNIITGHGWVIRPGTLDGCLTAVAAVERAYRSAGGVAASGAYPEVLDRVLTIVTAAWERDYRGVNGHVIEGLAQLIGRFGSSVDTNKLVTELSATRPNVLLGHAKTLRDAQGGTVPAALAKIVAGMHNKKRRSNLLPEWVWIR